MTPDFLLGFTACGCFVIALFFARFWRASQDRFFILMAAAFTIFGLNRIVLGFLDEASEARPLVYLFRLLAFLIILAAIIDKQRSESQP